MGKLPVLLKKFLNQVKKIHFSFCFSVNDYRDPMYNADQAFLQRISEMAGLEVETVRFEKWKKTKRK